jgi:hypothetical protein
MHARTKAASSSEGMEDSRIKPAWRASNCSVDSASSPSSSVTGRGLCIQRRRISAARGSDTARSRKPRSISASLGGSRSRRLARTAGRSPAQTGVPLPRGCAPSPRRHFVHARESRGARLPVATASGFLKIEPVLPEGYDWRLRAALGDAPPRSAMSTAGPCQRRNEPSPCASRA